MIVHFLIIVPILTILIMLFVQKQQVIRAVALTGAIIQLLVVINVLWQYVLNSDMTTGNVMLQTNVMWFAPLNIHYSVGVDGISIVMLFLTALVVIAAILVSWKEEYLTKEFFVLLTLLALGAYGFFISFDLFLMFFFLELAVIPKFLLILNWGSGNKTYSATKLVLMLIGASAILFMGILGIYYASSNGSPSFNMLTLKDSGMVYHWQLIFFPFLFIGF